MVVVCYNYITDTPKRILPLVLASVCVLLFLVLKVFETVEGVERGGREVRGDRCWVEYSTG